MVAARLGDAGHLGGHQLDRLVGEARRQHGLAPVADERPRHLVDGRIALGGVVVQPERQRQVALAEGDAPPVVQRDDRLDQLTLLAVDPLRLLDGTGRPVGLTECHVAEAHQVERARLPDALAGGTKPGQGERPGRRGHRAVVRAGGTGRGCAAPGSWRRPRGRPPRRPPDGTVRGLPRCDPPGQGPSRGSRARRTRGRRHRNGGRAGQPDGAPPGPARAGPGPGARCRARAAPPTRSTHRRRSESDPRRPRPRRDGGRRSRARASPSRSSARSRP